MEGRALGPQATQSWLCRVESESSWAFAFERKRDEELKVKGEREAGRGLCADPIAKAAVVLGMPCLGVQRALVKTLGFPFRKQGRLELSWGLGGQGGPQLLSGFHVACGSGCLLNS